MRHIVVGTQVVDDDVAAAIANGPFAEAKEVIGGYWIIQVKSKEEAVQWAQRVPAAQGDVIEIRPIFEMSDFPEEVKKAADNPTVQKQINR